jgi:hypothetical protein
MQQTNTSQRRKIRILESGQPPIQPNLHAVSCSDPFLFLSLNLYFLSSRFPVAFPLRCENHFVLTDESENSDQPNRRGRTPGQSSQSGLLTGDSATLQILEGTGLYGSCAASDWKAPRSN